MSIASIGLSRSRRWTVAVGDLVKRGKVRSFGPSEAGVANMRGVDVIQPVSALQVNAYYGNGIWKPEIISVLGWQGIDVVPFCALWPGLFDRWGRAPKSIRKVIFDVATNAIKARTTTPI
jgi:aryl-alcohol dehydrogenase-like predicted oxidoreductase